VESQAAALRQAQLQQFDLFLLNRFTPEGSGLAICQQLRESFSTAPVVIYSTAALASEQREGLRIGVTQYLTNPEDLLNLGQISSDLIHKTRSQVSAQKEAA
jgi:DNA-binding response OmpR family regulator